MRVITFGEIMLRLTPPGYYRFLQNDVMQATFGGGEANVAASLANFGINVSYITKLPEHAIGQAAVNQLRSLGIDTTGILRGGSRIGLYYLEKGASQRSSICIYDRNHTAIQEANPSEFNWDKIFDGADWFHFTGITPALGDNMAQACLDACQAAHRLHIPVSIDLNYRAKLWSREDARNVMTELCRYADICISNEEDAKDVFGIEAGDSNVNKGRLDKEGYLSVARQLTKKFPFKKVAITLRESHSASDNNWGALLYDRNTHYFTRTYPLHIVDRVGGGDAFSGALIYALLNDFNIKDAAEFAVAASALKHSIEGDLNLVTVDEVLKLVNGDGSGRVQR